MGVAITPDGENLYRGQYNRSCGSRNINGSELDRRCSGLLFIPVRAAGGQAPLQARPRFRVRAVKAT